MLDHSGCNRSVIDRRCFVKGMHLKHSDYKLCARQLDSIAK